MVIVVEVSVLRLSVLTLALLPAFSFSTAAQSVSQDAQASQKPVDAVPQQVRDNHSASPNRAATMAPSQPATSDKADTPLRDGSNNPEVRAPQPTAPSVTADPAGLTGKGTLKICLRMPDDSAFSGSASVHVMPTEGYEVSGTPSESDGEMIFAGMQPGTYTVEVNAPGFLSVRQKIEIEPGNRLRTQFVVMRTKPLPAREIAALPAYPASIPSPEAQPTRASWIPPGIDDLVPNVQPDVECPLPQVLKGAGLRMNQLITNLQKFSATERVEHYPIDSTGKRLIPQVRTFDYVAQVTTLSGGLFSIDEYRNGSFDRSRFPANIATEGVSAMALIFHPVLASDFSFKCEGLGNWRDQPAWLVHFRQREDRRSRIGGYRTQEHYYPFDLKGLAWIDAGSYQVVRLETELAQPIPEVGLTQELFIINYGSVAFHSRKTQLWLPQTAELYMQRRGNRFYRIHTFADFKIYTVDAEQNIQTPKESYCFTNSTDHDINGILTVLPASGISIKAISIQFTIPPGRSIYKVVGPGKDISMPVDEVGSATFTHNGPAGSIKADAYLVKESTLDVIADSPISTSP
jgi:hypothetical protein